jgi:subtilisin
MNARSDETRSARRGVTSRNSQYMIAPMIPGLSETAVTNRLQEMGGIDVVRSLAPQGTAGPLVVVARMSGEKAAALRRSTTGRLVVELDESLRCATALPALPPAQAVASALGPGFATVLRVLGDSDQPMEGAEVQLAGQQWRAQGVTDSDGKAALTLHGELPDTLEELVVKPRMGHWGLWRHQPNLQADTVNVVALRPLSEVREPGWGGRAMQLDRLPPEYGGAGAKISLIDTGAAATHKQLRSINQGFVTLADEDSRSWSQDTIGHGTACAGIISAAWDTPKVEVVSGVRGYASEAELHVCKLPPDARCSDLIAALDHCLATGVDLICLGLGCQRGSTIVEQRLIAAKRRGIGMIAAAGSNGGQVQFPACSPHVLAVGAIGQAGTFPDDSPHAAHAASAIPTGGGFFIPAFSCRGPELDLCAPGVATVSCQSPDGYAAFDGTSLATSHVTALAALVLAHHADFRRDFANRDARRVERLFQILQATAQPLGHPALTGAGLPNAPMALGLRAPAATYFAPLDAGVDLMRDAMRLAGLGQPDFSETAAPQPQRGRALVSPLPLSPQTPPIAAGADVGGLQDLKTAMQLAGLSAMR